MMSSLFLAPRGPVGGYSFRVKRERETAGLRALLRASELAALGGRSVPNQT